MLLGTPTWKTLCPLSFLGPGRQAQALGLLCLCRGLMHAQQALPRVAGLQALFSLSCDLSPCLLEPPPTPPTPSPHLAFSALSSPPFGFRPLLPGFDIPSQSCKQSGDGGPQLPGRGLSPSPQAPGHHRKWGPESLGPPPPHLSSREPVLGGGHLLSSSAVLGDSSGVIPTHPVWPRSPLCICLNYIFLHLEPLPAFRGDMSWPTEVGVRRRNARVKGAAAFCLVPPWVVSGQVRVPTMAPDPGHSCSPWASVCEAPGRGRKSGLYFERQTPEKGACFHCVTLPPKPKPREIGLGPARSLLSAAVSVSLAHRGAACAWPFITSLRSDSGSAGKASAYQPPPLNFPGPGSVSCPLPAGDTDHLLFILLLDFGTRPSLRFSSENGEDAQRGVA